MTHASLLTDLKNIQYLTGFKSSHAFLIHVTQKAYLFTDGRYIEKAQQLSKKKSGRISWTPILLDQTWSQKAQKLIQTHKIRTLDYEGDHLTVNGLKQFKKILKKLSWKKGNKWVEKQRACKDLDEIKKLEQAQRLSEQIFYTIKAWVRPGISEIEVAKEIKRLALKQADGVSFEPIVAFGAHSSMPHHENTSQKLKKGQLILIDMGVLYAEYASDMTRMLFTQSPTREEEAVYEAVLEAQEAAIQAMKPGTKTRHLDHLAREILKTKNYERYFTHSLGHGIGLEVHESPTLSSKSSDELAPGMVVTSEPGVYLPGKFGVRIEDMIVITPKGQRNITHAPKAIKDCILG